MNAMLKYAARFSAFSIAALLALSPDRALATSGTWNGTIDTNWSDAASWSGASGPTVRENATFDNAGKGNIDVDIGGGVTIRYMRFDNATCAPYTIGTTGQTLQFSDQNATILQTETDLGRRSAHLHLDEHQCPACPQCYA